MLGGRGPRWLAGILLVLLAACGSGYSTSPTAFVLPRLSGGGTVRLVAFRGEPTVVALFSSSCRLCASELPLLAGAAQELHGQVAFIGVDSDDPGDGLVTARQGGIGSWPLARDVGGAHGTGLLDALESSGVLPLTAFYDRDGGLLSVQSGELSAAGLGTTLYQLYGARVQL
ncbi:MAG: TlpA disulfide reductase family protein [Candidatus Dormiibacterota bacterium]